MAFELAVDIGGTFTDVYLRDERGETAAFKSPTTPADLSEGLLDAIGKAAAAYDRSTTELLSKTSRLVHGTTASTNAIIEDKTSKTALLCTEGFRDTLLFREGGKDDPYDWEVDYPEPFVPRALTVGVAERITAQGEIWKSLDESQVRDVIEDLKRQNVEAVAVSLLWSHVNPVHEQRISEIFEDAWPDVHVSVSHEVNPTIREYRRTSSTAIDASIHHLVDEYLSKIERVLQEHGFAGNLLMIVANGGVLSPAELRATPIWTVDSGPTMLPVAAVDLVTSEVGKSDVVALDMGGTSLDMCVVTDGYIPRTREATIGDDYMLGIEKVEVRSVGPGGGSIAYVDDGGLIHIGPESAGADPGPACYDTGGTDPTLTDAALVLGYINDEYFLGGSMDVSPERAKAVIQEEIAGKLGIRPVEAAYAMYTTAMHDMVNSIKDVTIERGIDTRNYVLSGGGGMLGTFAVPIAKELRMSDVLLSREAGVVSSTGGLASDTRRDFSQSFFTTSADFDHDGVRAVVDSLQSAADVFFDRMAIPDDRRSLSLYVEARYPNQVWELQVELPNDTFQRGDEAVLTERFHEKHEQTYGYRTNEDVEFMHWRAEAIGATLRFDDHGTRESDDASTVSAAYHGDREAYFGETVQSVPGYLAESLPTGQRIQGPAVIDAENTTIVVPPESSLSITASGNYHIPSQ